VRILYSAIDQAVPGPHGGSVHVTSVAEGLAALGHDVHVLVSPGEGGTLPQGRATWSALPPPFGDRRLRLVRAREVSARAKALKPDVVIERYYNFGGEGILAARATGALAVLEVNAPIVDHPGSSKALVDRLLLVQPMRRWREWQCDHAHLFIAPSRRMIPPHVPAGRILKVEWGADTDRFHPRAKAGAASPFSRTDSDTVAVFSGAFRAWHGAIHLVEAIRRLRARGRQDIKAVLIGAGPELMRVREAAADLDGVTFTGALAHESVPEFLAAADVGVAPFDISRHPSLAYDFHWSPLKIFEYMASGLPVVAPRIDRLSEIVEDGREGILYDAADVDALARALERLADATLRTAMGGAARTRAVEQYSWRAHCRTLDEALTELRERTACGS
jgi:glycosyltransferase involved in cell wall biosynthesis